MTGIGLHDCDIRHTFFLDVGSRHFAGGPEDETQRESDGSDLDPK